MHGSLHTPATLRSPTLSSLREKRAKKAKAISLGTKDRKAVKK
jgi:hypothetical protein